MPRRATWTAALIAAGLLLLVGRDIATIRDRGAGPWCRSETLLCDGHSASARSFAAMAGVTAENVRGNRASSRPTVLHRTVADGRGTRRDFLVQEPADRDGPEPVAVTFVFHGLNGTAADAQAYGIQDATGASKASIFVFPQGLAFQNYGLGWDDACNGYDMVFFDRMLADIEAGHRVDKVFVAGFSWGCDFVTALACCRGNRIRGVAAAACSDDFRNPADYRTYANFACPVVNRAAIRFTHDVGGDSAYPAPLFASTSKLFRAMNACPNSAIQGSHGFCRSYPGCANPTSECVKPGIGHSPGPNWGADTWAFFASLN